LIRIKLIIESSTLIPGDVIKEIGRLRNELRLSGCRCSDNVPPLLCLCRGTLLRLVFTRATRESIMGVGTYHGITLIMTVESTEPSSAFEICDKVASILKSLGFRVSLHYD